FYLRKHGERCDGGCAHEASRLNVDPSDVTIGRGRDGGVSKGDLRGTYHCFRLCHTCQGSFISGLCSAELNIRDNVVLHQRCELEHIDLCVGEISFCRGKVSPRIV